MQSVTEGCGNEEPRHVQEVTMQGIQMLVLLTLVVFSMTADGCSRTMPESRVRLIGELWSNISLTDLKQCTPLGNLAMVPVFERREDSSARGPYFHRERFRLEKYSDLGESGSLVLDFMNGRLVSTFFYPDSLGRYVKRFACISGVHLTEEGVDRGDLYIAVRRFPEERDCVMWRDMRLESYADAIESYYSD